MDRCLANTLDDQERVLSTASDPKGSNYHLLCTIESGFVAILIVTSLDFGGLTEVLKISNEGGRFPNQFEFDPRYRHTFWSVIFGNSTGFAVASYTCQQYKVQRYLSCKSLKEAQKCIYYAAFGIMAICIAGMILIKSELDGHHK